MKYTILLALALAVCPLSSSAFSVLIEPTDFLDWSADEMDRIGKDYESGKKEVPIEYIIGLGQDLKEIAQDDRYSAQFRSRAWHYHSGMMLFLADRYRLRLRFAVHYGKLSYHAMKESLGLDPYNYDAIRSLTEAVLGFHKQPTWIQRLIEKYLEIDIQEEANIAWQLITNHPKLKDFSESKLERLQALVVYEI